MLAAFGHELARPAWFVSGPLKLAGLKSAVGFVGLLRRGLKPRPFKTFSSPSSHAFVHGFVGQAVGFLVVFAEGVAY